MNYSIIYHRYSVFQKFQSFKNPWFQQNEINQVPELQSFKLSKIKVHKIINFQSFQILQIQSSKIISRRHTRDNSGMF